MHRDQAALSILLNLKSSLAGNIPEGFVFNPAAGLCFHFEENPRCAPCDEIDSRRAFYELGYDVNFPVEMPFGLTKIDAWQMYIETDATRYDPSTAWGERRLKLIDTMIEYYKIALAQDPV